MVVQHNLTAMNSNRMLGLTTASQAGQYIAQELSKPHNQAHIAKAIGEVIDNFKKKK